MVTQTYFKAFTSRVGQHTPKIINTFKTAWDEGKSSTWAIKELKDLGITYRRTNMLEDFRRAGALTRVKAGNLEGEVKAMNYFNKVVEPFRKDHNMTNREAWDAIHTWEKDQYETAEEAELLAKAGSQYNFGDTP